MGNKYVRILNNILPTIQRTAAHNTEKKIIGADVPEVAKSFGYAELRSSAKQSSVILPCLDPLSQFKHAFSDP